MDMNSEPSICKEDIRKLCIEAGACAVGFARVEPIPEGQASLFNEWLADGRHAELSYMERYGDIRNNPALLLEGAKTIICCAFAYANATTQRHHLFADYALGRDYHEVLRQRLSPVAKALTAAHKNSATRICVDTAPLRERFWATRAGVGIIGRNNQLIVPGIGSRVFLAEILWTEEIEPDKSLETETCSGCKACALSCPRHALDGEGRIDCRRCLSYLTIEHRGELPNDLTLSGRIYGCDICQDVCPHNRSGRNPEVIPEFEPTAALMSVSVDSIKEMNADEFSRIFSHSAVKRTKLIGLQRNALKSKH